MATTPQDRSKQLHNFSLPCLKWGSQRVLRCVKATDHQPGSSSSPMVPLHNGFQKPINLAHLNQASSDLIRFNNGGDHKRLKVASSSPSLLQDEKGNNNESSRPWNLRARRSACKAPLRIEDAKNNIVDSQRRNLNLVMDSPKTNADSLLVKRLQSVEMVVVMKEKIKFSVPLAKEEIEQDFMEMARIRPPRRSKKRPRIVQKYLDSIFPGLWLSEVNADSYKVPEVPFSQGSCSPILSGFAILILRYGVLLKLVLQEFLLSTESIRFRLFTIKLAIDTGMI